MGVIENAELRRTLFSFRLQLLWNGADAADMGVCELSMWYLARAAGRLPHSRCPCYMLPGAAAAASHRLIRPPDVLGVVLKFYPGSFVRLPDIHVRGLMFYNGFFLISFFRQLLSDIDNWARVFESTKGLLHCSKVSWTLVHKRLKTGPEILPTLTILFRPSPSQTL